jgi:hypothetical protein
VIMPPRAGVLCVELSFPHCQTVGLEYWFMYTWCQDISEFRICVVLGVRASTWCDNTVFLI